MMFRRRPPDRELETLAARLQAIPRPPIQAGVVQRARVRVLSATHSGAPQRRLIPRLVLASALAALLATGGAGAALAAPSALPGDPLYGLKRFEEHVQLALARTAGEAEAVRQQHKATRAKEAQALEARQRGPTGRDGAPESSASPAVGPPRPHRR